MLKKIMTTLLFTGALTASVSAKVTLDDANADAEWYAQQNAHLSDTLLPMQPNEFDQNAKSGVNQLGTWVQLSSSYNSYFSVNDAGQYSHLISADSVGQSCLKGEKGLLLSADREKKCDHGHGSSCTYGDEILAVKGYPAECR